MFISWTFLNNSIPYKFYFCFFIFTIIIFSLFGKIFIWISFFIFLFLLWNFFDIFKFSKFSWLYKRTIFKNWIWGIIFIWKSWYFFLSCLIVFFTVNNMIFFILYSKILCIERYRLFTYIYELIFYFTNFILNFYHFLIIFFNIILLINVMTNISIYTF